MTKVLELAYRGSDGDVRLIRSDPTRYMVSVGKGPRALTIAVSDLVSARVVDDEAEAQARAERARHTAFYPDNDSLTNGGLKHE